MHQPTQSLLRRALFLGGFLILPGFLAFMAVLWPSTYQAQRLSAQARWAARSFSGYRIMVQIKYANTTCFQELEIRDEQVQRLFHDTCKMSWLSSLTVARMFQLSERIEFAPECYPSSEPCPCQRTRVGFVDYDAELGYPHVISYRRLVRPNLLHLDYWKRLWQSRELPDCTAISRNLSIEVQSLMPLR